MMRSTRRAPRRYRLDVLLAAEQQQRAAMSAHLAEVAAVRAVRCASSPFWPPMLTASGYAAWAYLEQLEAQEQRRRLRAIRRASSPFWPRMLAAPRRAPRGGRS